MIISSLRLQGFRKHYDTTIDFSDSTFLIGENNVGKSSVLQALDYLLNNKAVISNDEYFSCITSDGKINQSIDTIILTAQFNNLPIEAKEWRGFKGRILTKKDEDGKEMLSFVYRKTFLRGSKPVIEMLEYKKEIKSDFQNCETIQEYLEKGLAKELLTDSIQKIGETKKLTTKEKGLFEQLDELYDVDETEENWVKNPGGIPQNVISKLPKFLLIPAQDKTDEITGKSGTLQSTLNELFSEIRESSENYKQAQMYLEKLGKELNPEDDSTEISKMITELNGIVSDVFPNTGINATANLSDADVIKPTFNVEMSSNISTATNLQGTGLIRSTVFALLRYKSLRDNKKAETNESRALIIGFEEPEIYLHPNAINKMRDTIYSLAESENNQIVCTTHSPFMIDISKKPTQILCSLFVEANSNVWENECVETVNSISFNVTAKYKSLQADLKTYIKMLLKVDESIAKCFFAKKVLIVEGDTEQIVISETISRMPEAYRTKILSDWHVVRARGKAVIISLIKYLKAMAIDISVIHDGDYDTAGAEKFNKPIKDALENDDQLVVLKNCIEDVLGHNVPSSDKPYFAYKHIQDKWTDWESIPSKWKSHIEKIFNHGETID